MKNRSVSFLFTVSLVLFVLGIWALSVAGLGASGVEAFSVSLLYLVILVVAFLLVSLVVGVVCVALYLHARNMAIPLLIVALAFAGFIVAGMIKVMLGGGSIDFSIFDLPQFIKTLFLI